MTVVYSGLLFRYNCCYFITVIHAYCIEARITVPFNDKCVVFLIRIVVHSYLVAFLNCCFILFAGLFQDCWFVVSFTCHFLRTGSGCSECQLLLFGSQTSDLLPSVMKGIGYCHQTLGWCVVLFHRYFLYLLFHLYSSRTISGCSEPQHLLPSSQTLDLFSSVTKRMGYCYRTFDWCNAWCDLAFWSS